jgi:hypothetical protein
MKKTREFILKLGMVILVLAVTIGAGGVYAQTQDNPGNTETGQIPVSSPGSSTWDDEAEGGLQNQGEVSSSSDMGTEGNTPTYTPGIQYEGSAPDENVRLGTATNAPNIAYSYFFVSGNAFQGKSSTTTYSYDSAGCIYLTSVAGQVSVEMVIPNGSVIKYLRLYYRDSNASEGITGYITSINPGISGIDLVNVSSSGSGGYGTALSKEITHTVDTSAFAYTLIGWPTISDNTVELCGMRVAYYAPTMFGVGLPLIWK